MKPKSESVLAKSRVAPPGIWMLAELSAVPAHAAVS
jgi:hypothetical protein